MRSASLESGRLPEWATGPYNISRIATVGGLSLAGLVAADRLSGEIRWRGRETIVDYTDQPSESDGEAWLFLPGLGIQSSENIARRLAPALDAPSIYVELPDKKPNTEAIGESIGDFTNKHDINRVSVYGHSLGGIMMGAVAPHLPDHIKFNRVLFDSSPSPLGIDDVRIRRDARLAKLVARLGYTGGVLSSMAVAAFHHREESDNSIFGDISGCVSKAFDRIGPKGGSSAAWVWQIRTLYEADARSMSEAICPRLLPDTRIGYLMPDKPERDKTINVEQAVSGWEKAVSRHIDKLPIPNGGHAISEKTTGDYSKVISEWLGASIALADPSDVSAAEMD